MKKSYLLLYSLFALMFFSCQDETETIKINSENSFTKTSPISSLIARVSQYETTADNVLDGTSNCSIKLPAHITIDGQYVYVSSETDFQAVQNIKNQSSSDDDKVHFGYPITIIYPNYSEYSVTSEEQFDDILDGYGDDSPYHDINCIDFDYPISINIYNSNNQVASSVVIHNDNALYSFVENLATGEIVGIVFPVTLTKTVGGNVIVNNNTQLETAINTAVDECNTSGPSPLVLSEVLTSGTWNISYFYGDNDETYYYNGYNFTFNTNGTSIAVKNSATINGSWDIHNDGNTQRLDLNFNGTALEELHEGWKLLELTATRIRLKHESGGGSDNHYLNFTKN
ncbi:hypothetical protein QWY90_11175 [Flavobacterium paronense]|uniref:Lipocalin-like domain-containing protein n=1 Tax=Flavobacterium paronense TaxID=1392775 RepID=A0ABV5GCD1_9FLAO|nr:hypothetical protein [Flavobacterium paronense]MDN3677870.1 hypothetical protein [Flavobacterium paronense]